MSSKYTYNNEEENNELVEIDEIASPCVNLIFTLGVVIQMTVIAFLSGWIQKLL